MPVQRPSFIPRKLRGFTESLYSPNTSHKSQLPNTLPCSTTAKGFIRHSAICPRVSSKPITIFQGSTCPPKLDQIKAELGLLSGPFDLKPDMAIEILFLMAGFNMKSQALSNEVRKMHASIPARICFQDVGDTVIDYSRAKDLFA